MKVEDRLASVVPDVGDDAIAVLAHALTLGDLGADTEAMPQELAVLVGSSRNAGNGLSGNDQDMSRGLGIVVAKGQHLVVLENDVRGNFTRENLGKDGFGHGRGLRAITDSQASGLRASPSSPNRTGISPSRMG